MSAPETFLSRFDVPEPPIDAAGASVAIILREGAREIETLLIERTVREEDPASGQVALPGGRVRSSDRSLQETALREIEEEVGLRGSDLVRPPRFVGLQEARVFSMTVAIFAATLGPSSNAPAVTDPAEVAQVFWFPRSALERASQLEWKSPQGSRGIEGVPYEGHIVWGFTLRALREFFGRAEPGAGTEPRP
ncbi:MAG: CoA pyrophosphatase [Thermoplasmata archaeon]